MGRHLYALMRWLPLALGVVTLGMLSFGHVFSIVAVLMIGWGTLNWALAVCRSTWLTKGIADEPESGGGLLVAATQLAIMLGGALGGFLLDQWSIAATLAGGEALLFAASLRIGSGERIGPAR